MNYNSQLQLRVRQIYSVCWSFNGDGCKILVMHLSHPIPTSMLGKEENLGRTLLLDHPNTLSLCIASVDSTSLRLTSVQIGRL